MSECDNVAPGLLQTVLALLFDHACLSFCGCVYIYPHNCAVIDGKMTAEHMWDTSWGQGRDFATAVQTPARDLLVHVILLWASMWMAKLDEGIFQSCSRSGTCILINPTQQCRSRFWWKLKQQRKLSCGLYKINTSKRNKSHDVQILV